MSGNDLSIAVIAVTTNLAAAAGTVGALVMSSILRKRYDPSMALNGVIAGLVSITAGTANVSPASAVIIGLIGGAIVVVAAINLERIFKIDDPVGAISAHGIAGAWGTLAVGFFAQASYGGVDGLFFGGSAAWLPVCGSCRRFRLGLPVGVHHLLRHQVDDWAKGQ